MYLHRFKVPHPNIKLLASFLIAICSNLIVFNASATTDPNLVCTDVKFVFARGSGAAVGSTRDFVPFQSAVDSVFAGRSYGIYELGSKAGGYSGRSYPAPGIGVSTWERFDTSLGALFSGGETGRYGDSVEEGSDEAMSFIFLYHAKCPSSKIILAGYSQGAQVVSRTLQKVEPSWVTAALTFGDPKLYLPEGKRDISTSLGLSTKACMLGSASYSSYRAYVPDCYAYQGILGGYQPYHPSGYTGKVYAYCQFHDVICSSYVDPDNLAYGHASYDEQGTYARAVGEVFDDIYGVTDHATSSLYDVVIFIDNSYESANYLPAMVNYALRLSSSVIKRGGRVAFATMDGGADGTLLCDFTSCDTADTGSLLRSISPLPSGVSRLPAASLSVMNALRWNAGAHKSFVILTPSTLNADAVSRAKLVARALEIDPVNFYIVTTTPAASSFATLASETDGAVFSPISESAIDDTESAIFSHHEATDFSYAQTLRKHPIIRRIAYEQTSASSLKVSVSANDAQYYAIAINDFILGYTDRSVFEITDLDFTSEQTICLSPISDDGFRASAVCTTVPIAELPKAPNSGRAM